MSNRLEPALADEVLAQVAARRYTHKEMQARSGIKARTWGNYFVQRDRAIPFSAVVKIAQALDMKPSTLLHLAEQRAANASGPELAAEEALRKVTPRTAAEARRLAKEIRDRPDEGDGTAERATSA